MKVIVNPAAAGGKAGKIWEKIKSKGFEAIFTGGAGDAIKLAEELSGEESFCFVGGDGTLNEIINGLLSAEIPAKPTIGIIPIGSCGDFVKTLGIPNNPTEAIEIIKRGHSETFDAGICEFTGWDGKPARRFFINITEIGIGGYVADMVNRYGKWARGTLPYLVFAIYQLFKYKNRRMRIMLDGKRRFEADIRILAVANGKYYGGGMKIAPFADPKDGLFDVVIVKDMGALESFIKIPKLYSGEHAAKRELEKGKIIYERVKKVEVEGAEGMPFEMEGEVPGVDTRYFEILPKAVRFFVA